nr:monocopper oxidase-like protein sku5 [Quercus suber]
MTLPLYANSRWIVDEVGGQRVKLACVNWVSHLEPMVTEGLSKQPMDAISKKIASMGFNRVRLTWPLFLVTNDSLASLTVSQSCQSLGLSESIARIQANNPSIIDLPLIKAYQMLRASLDVGNGLPMPDAILINGLGPNEATFDFQPGATYRLRISNLGLKTSINFRIQDHLMRLVETEGSYTTQDDEYDSLDIHVGQSYSVLVTAKNDTNGTSYPMIASSRFTKNILFGLGVIRYPGFVAHPLGPISPGPTPFNYTYSMLQAQSISMGFGTWDESKKESYNLFNAVSRSTIQVYPLAWTAVLVKLDNQGMWNLRSQNAENWYLGQELYIRVKGIGQDDPSTIPIQDEAPIPENVIKCGKTTSL